MPQETIVTTLSGQTEEDRLVVVLCQYAAGANALELRQQSWGDGVGWFTQSTVEMSPRQVANLRNALGGSPGQPPGGGRGPRCLLEIIHSGISKYQSYLKL